MNRKGRPQVREGHEFEEEVIQIDRVTRVVKGGRRLRFRATVVIGNKKGKVGMGIGKSVEVQGAIKKAVAQAKKSLIDVPIVGDTIPHRVQVKFKSAKMIIMPGCPGTGIIAGGPLRKILELAGVKDVLSKVLGCKNRLSNSQAAIIALGQLKTFPWRKKLAPAPVAVVAGTPASMSATKPPVPPTHGPQGAPRPPVPPTHGPQGGPKPPVPPAHGPQGAPKPPVTPTPPKPPVAPAPDKK
jgi:small subunit ribosomal protein S5